MSLQKEIQLLTLSGPGIAVLLALIFYGLWSYQRTKGYLLLVSGAYFLYAVSLSMQILRLPADPGINAITTAALYLAGIILLCQGVLARHKKNTPYRLQLLISATVLAGLYYFYYIDENVLVRIYILNFGIGLTLLSCFIALNDLRRGKRIEQIFYWTFTAFTLNFFIRTPLTLLTAKGLTATEHFNSSIFWLVLQISLHVFVILLALLIIIVALLDRIDLLRKERDEDPLTGCLNRRGFFTAVQHMAPDTSNQQRYILLADLDHFKKVNDKHGHTVGDEVLRLFASTARKVLPAQDVMGRTGGEEFIFLLNSPCSAQEAIELANRLRLAISTAQCMAVSPPISITASFGLGPFYLPIDTAIQQADKFLYLAKNSGRNNVAVDPSLLES